MTLIPEWGNLQVINQLSFPHSLDLFCRKKPISFITFSRRNFCSCRARATSQHTIYDECFYININAAFSSSKQIEHLKNDVVRLGINFGGKFERKCFNQPIPDFFLLVSVSFQNDTMEIDHKNDGRIGFEPLVLGTIVLPASPQLLPLFLSTLFFFKSSLVRQVDLRQGKQQSYKIYFKLW